MRAAVVVASKHGTTVEIGRRIADALGGDVPVLNLADHDHPDISRYDTVVLGTAVYDGAPREQMTSFAQNADLGEKRLGLFVSGMAPRAQARQEELATAFPPALSERAAATAFLGGALQFDKLDPAELSAVKELAKASADVDAIDDRAIAHFAQALLAG